VAAVLPACVVIGAVGLTGCEFPIVGGGGEAETEAASPSGTSMPTTLDPAAETGTAVAAPTTPPVEPDEGLVAACVEYIQFQAYVGDEESLEIWVRAGQSVEGVDRECRTIVVADLDHAKKMRTELDELHSRTGNSYGHDQGVGNPHATTTEVEAASTTLAPGCHPSYGDCLPIVTDIDCVRDRGSDGPIYQGLSVLVLGVDEYELDRDGDGLACEPGDH
jgi:resuscitation-promoting factor RpfB